MVSFVGNAVPFRVRFVTNADEFEDDVNMDSRNEQSGLPGGILGFKLDFKQI